MPFVNYETRERTEREREREREKDSWLLSKRAAARKKFEDHTNIGPSKGINCVGTRFISNRSWDEPVKKWRKIDETICRVAVCQSGW